MKLTSLQTGFALVEAVIAITIVSIAAVTIMAQISQANVQSGRSLVQTEAVFFANAYLNEIVARPFDDPDGVDGEAARRFYDDVDDYNGLINVGARDGNGNLIPGGNRYTVRVSVANSNVLPGVAAADALLVTVTVTDPVGANMLVNAIRLRP
jgi:MSHA pilin protein MshD